jgi:hypothetical protein
MIKWFPLQAALSQEWVDYKHTNQMCATGLLQSMKLRMKATENRTAILAFFFIFGAFLQWVLLRRETTMDFRDVADRSG